MAHARTTNFPFYSYAAMTWLMLTDYTLQTDENDDDDAIWSLMRSLFDH